MSKLTEEQIDQIQRWGIALELHISKGNDNTYKVILSGDDQSIINFGLSNAVFSKILYAIENIVNDPNNTANLI